MHNIGRIFVESHRGALDLLLRQGPAVLIITLVGIATAYATNFIHPYIGNAAARLLVDTLVQCAGLWVTAPAMVAIFRHIILGEAVDPSPLQRSAATGAFFNAAALINLLGIIPMLFVMLAHGGSQTTLSSLPPTAGASVAVWVMLTRLTTFLPGIAVGRESSSLGLSLRESRGHFWFIASSFIAAIAPIFITGLVIGYFFRQVPAALTPLVYLVPGSIMALIALSATALLYQHLRLDPAPTAPPQIRPDLQPRGPRRSFGRLTYEPAPQSGLLPVKAETMRISAIAVGQAAYRDLFNIVREMWPVLLLLSALYFVCTMAWFIAPIFVSSWVGRMVVRMLIFIGIGWLAAPYYIALHRFVSTGEVRWIPPRDNYGRASLVYFAWSAITVMLWFMPLILGNVVDAFVPRLAGLASLVLFCVVFAILVKMTTLLPAAALAPERASWAQAMEDSRGRFRRFWLATTGAALPAIIVLAIIGRAAGSQSITALPFFALAVPALLTLQIVPLAAGTRLYESLAPQLPTARMRQVLGA